jgi:hypothetical protein
MTFFSEHGVMKWNCSAGMFYDDACLHIIENMPAEQLCYICILTFPLHALGIPSIVFEQWRLVDPNY